MFINDEIGRCNRGDSMSNLPKVLKVLEHYFDRNGWSQDINYKNFLNDAVSLVKNHDLDVTS